MKKYVAIGHFKESDNATCVAMVGGNKMTQEELLDIIQLAELKQGEIWSEAHQRANALPDSKDAQVKEDLAWAKLCKLHTTMLNLVDEINGYHHLEKGELR